MSEFLWMAFWDLLHGWLFLSVYQFIDECIVNPIDPMILWRR